MVLPPPLPLPGCWTARDGGSSPGGTSSQAEQGWPQSPGSQGSCTQGLSDTGWVCPQSHSATPLLGWAGEKKHSHRLVG